MKTTKQNQKPKLKKWWVTWSVDGQKKGMMTWDFSAKQAEDSILPWYNQTAIPYEEKYK